MMRFTRCFTVAIPAVVLLAGSAWGQTNLVLNPGFEAGLSAANWTVTGNTNGGGSRFVAPAGALPPHSASAFFQWTDGSSGGVSGVYDGAFLFQNLNVSSLGLPHELSFFIARNVASKDQQVRATATSNGGSLGDLFDQTFMLNALTNPTAPSYVEFGGLFTPTTSTVQLRFEDVSSDSQAIAVALDDVSVVATPEPAALLLWTMLGVGLVGGGWLLRRRTPR